MHLKCLNELIGGPIVVSHIHKRVYKCVQLPVCPQPTPAQRCPRNSRRTPRRPTTSSWGGTSTGRCWCPGASGCTPMNRSQCFWGRTPTSQTDTEPICPPDCASKGDAFFTVLLLWVQQVSMFTCFGFYCCCLCPTFNVGALLNVLVLCAASSSCPTRRWISGVICWASSSSSVSVFTTWRLFCPPSAPPEKTMSSTLLRSSASRYRTQWCFRLWWTFSTAHILRSGLFNIWKTSVVIKMDQLIQCNPAMLV